jgi:hypothetical protein
VGAASAFETVRGAVEDLVPLNNVVLTDEDAVAAPDVIVGVLVVTKVPPLPSVLVIT